MGRSVDSKINIELHETLNNNFDKEEKGEKVILLYFKTYHKATVIKSVVLSGGQTHRWIYQNWESRNKPLHIDELIFDKDAKSIHW